MTPADYTEALIGIANMSARDATFMRLLAACRQVVDAPGPVTQLDAICKLRELARQLDQEESCQNPSTGNSSTTSEPPESKSSATPKKSGNGSHATSTRTRTIKPAPATKPATPATRRRTP